MIRFRLARVTTTDEPLGSPPVRTAVYDFAADAVTSNAARFCVVSPGYAPKPDATTVHEDVAQVDRRPASPPHDPFRRSDAAIG